MELSVLFLRVLLLLSAAVTASAAPEDPDNADYFFACSGESAGGASATAASDERATVASLVEGDPSLVHATTKDGEHCLHLCAISGNAGIVRLLLEKGADPNVRSGWEQGQRMHPLSWNTYYGRFDNIMLLLKHGADVNADFDIGMREGGGMEKGTVLDVVERILAGGSQEGADRERFVKTKEVLVQHGAATYASLTRPEL